MYINLHLIQREKMIVKKIFMEEELIRLADLSSLSRLPNSMATIVKNGNQIFADVVFKDSSEYFRAAHRDGSPARSFGSVETAAKALVSSGFPEIVLKYLDEKKLPEWIHVNDIEFLEWEQRFEAMGPYAPIDELKQHLKIAPDGAPSKDYLTAFIEGYDRAKREN